MIHPITLRATIDKDFCKSNPKLSPNFLKIESLQFSRYNSVFLSAFWPIIFPFSPIVFVSSKQSARGNEPMRVRCLHCNTIGTDYNFYKIQIQTVSSYIRRQTLQCTIDKFWVISNLICTPDHIHLIGQNTFFGRSCSLISLDNGVYLNYLAMHRQIVLYSITCRRGIRAPLVTDITSGFRSRIA